MKKLLWILGTSAVWLLYCFIAAAAMIIWNILKSIVTRSEIQSFNQDIYNIVMWGGTAIIIVLSIWLWKRFKAKCHACKRWGALEWALEEETGRENISVKMQLEERNSRGDLIGTSEQYIPGKRITYKDTYQCKHCGNLETRTRRVGGANL